MKIPQSVIRSIMEGPLQPSDPTKRHPDMQPKDENTKNIIDAFHRNNPLMANKKENTDNIQEDIEVMSHVSPSVKYIASGEINMKKASASSKNKKERISAVENTKCNPSKNMHPNSVKAIRSAEVADTSLTKGFNGGTSLIHPKEIEAQDKNISRISKASNHNRKMKVANKYSGMDKSNGAVDKRAEQQKSRKLKDLYNEADGNIMTCASSFGSSQQYSPEMPHSSFDEDYISVFKSKMPEYKNLPKEMKRTAKMIEQYQLDKMKSNFSKMGKSSEEDIQSRLKHAKEKSQEIVQEEERNRTRIAKTEVPSVDILKQMLMKETSVKETKNLKKDTKKIQAQRELRDSVDQRGKTSKPTTNVVDKMLKIYNGDK